MPITIASERNRNLLVGLAMVLATLVTYAPAMQAGFIWDDDHYVTENPHLARLEGLGRIWTELRATPQYYPMVFTSFWLEHKLWGLEPAGFHVVNILLHAGCGLLLWLVLERLAFPWALPAALLFLLHPVHVESVAWVTERKNVLSGVFYMASALVMVRFLGLESSDERPRWDWRSYGTGLLLFVAALLSKSVTCSLPAALLLVIWWKKGRITRHEVALLTPFFALGLCSGLLTAWLERSHVGAEGAEWGYSFVERCLIAGRVVIFYVTKLLWPRDLMFNYPRWDIDAGDFSQCFYPLGVLAVVGGAWAGRRRWGRGPLVGLLYFIGTLFPALGFFDVYPFRFSFVADHFQYLASIGILTILAGCAGRLWSLPARQAKSAVFACGVLVLVLLGWRSHQQTLVYRDVETLWRHTIAMNPDSWLAHNNLANLLARTGRLEESLHHHREALRARPDPEVSHNNLADTLAKHGRTEEAEHHFREALRINPDYALAHLNYGFLQEARGDTAGAKLHYEAALRIWPDYVEAHLSLGQIKEAEGDWDGARLHYQRAIQARPGSIEARQAMGRLLARRGEHAAARLELEEVLRLNPQSDGGHYNLALVLVKSGDVDRALTHFLEAVRINPRLAEAHYQAGLLLARSGKLEQAGRHLGQAIALNPEDPQAHLHLGLVLGLQGRMQESLGHLETAVRLAPQSPQARMRLAQTLWLSGRREAAQAEHKELESLDRAAAVELTRWMESNGGAPGDQ